MFIQLINNDSNPILINTELIIIVAPGKSVRGGENNNGYTLLTMANGQILRIKGTYEEVSKYFTKE